MDDSIRSGGLLCDVIHCVGDRRTDFFSDKDETTLERMTCGRWGTDHMLSLDKTNEATLGTTNGINLPIQMLVAESAGDWISCSTDRVLDFRHSALTA